ncbi:MAG: hypothetical protein KGI75_29030 [Rhizobiaceae bacterium]|nr:hypothetical protein [Rhizobiaceae bacterium]
MKKMATAAHTARQNTINSHRSAYLERFRRNSSVAIKSGSASFMTWSALCLMTAYKIASFGRTPINTAIFDRNRNLRNVRSFDIGFLGFWSVPLGARLCSEWERRSIYLGMSSIFLKKSTQYCEAAIMLAPNGTSTARCLLPIQAVR